MSISAQTVKWLRVDQDMAYAQLAVATCVIYDHITTLDLEIELVWARPKWTAVQLLFLINRYVGAGSIVYFTTVRHVQLNTLKVRWGMLQAFFVGIPVWSMQAIMIFRVSSMYIHCRRIIFLLCAAFTVEVGALFSMLSINRPTSIPVPDPAPGVHACVKGTSPRLSYTIWLPVMAFEFLILALSVRVALRYNDAIKLKRLPHNIGNSLIYVLLRDSILFPFIALTVCTVNLIGALKLPILIYQILANFTRLLPIILGCRLILNLRESYYEPFSDEVTHSQSVVVGRSSSEDA